MANHNQYVCLWCEYYFTFFLASTLYHSIAAPKAKRLLKTLDHCAIFLLIAGSYTPYLLVSLRTPLAYWLMGVIWAIALIGIIGKIVFVYRFKKLSLITYLIMGWLSVIAVYQLVIHIDINGVILLGLGGVIYSLGVIFMSLKDPIQPCYLALICIRWLCYSILVDLLLRKASLEIKMA